MTPSPWGGASPRELRLAGGGRSLGSHGSESFSEGERKPFASPRHTFPGRKILEPLK